MFSWFETCVDQFGFYSRDKDEDSITNFMYKKLWDQRLVELKADAANKEEEWIE